MQNEAARAAGESIRAVRVLAGLTLTEAAQLNGRSPGYLSLVETGKARNVSEKYIANTMGALSAYIAQRGQNGEEAAASPEVAA
jgi:transcriptional regulator with XRE-family HTH domain